MLLDSRAIDGYSWECTLGGCVLAQCTLEINLEETQRKGAVVTNQTWLENHGQTTALLRTAPC